MARTQGRRLVFCSGGAAAEWIAAFNYGETFADYIRPHPTPPATGTPLPTVDYRLARYQGSLNSERPQTIGERGRPRLPNFIRSALVGLITESERIKIDVEQRRPLALLIAIRSTPDATSRRMAYRSDALTECQLPPGPDLIRIRTMGSELVISPHHHRPASNAEKHPRRRDLGSPVRLIHRKRKKPTAPSLFPAHVLWGLITRRVRQGGPYPILLFP